MTLNAKDLHIQCQQLFGNLVDEFNSFNQKGCDWLGRELQRINIEIDTLNTLLLDRQERSSDPEKIREELAVTIVKYHQTKALRDKLEKNISNHRIETKIVFSNFHPVNEQVLQKECSKTLWDCITIVEQRSEFAKLIRKAIPDTSVIPTLQKERIKDSIEIESYDAQHETYALNAKLSSLMQARVQQLG